MKRSSTTPPDLVPVDRDLVEQAHPGLGVPTQDPTAAAQYPLTPDEAEREANSVLMGGGVGVGMATGAGVGVVVAGPVGVVVGGTVGAVVGALGAAAVGTIVKPEDSSSPDTAAAETGRPGSHDSAGIRKATGKKPTVAKDHP
jgi:hypothetical protein